MVHIVGDCVTIIKINILTMESWDTQYRWGGWGMYGSKYLTILHFITPLAQSNQSIGHNLSSKGSINIAFPVSK